MNSCDSFGPPTVDNLKACCRNLMLNNDRAVYSLGEPATEDIRNLPRTCSRIRRVREWHRLQLLSTAPGAQRNGPSNTGMYKAFAFGNISMLW